MHCHMQKGLASIFVVLFLVGTLSAPVSAKSSTATSTVVGTLSAKSAVLLEADSGAIIVEKNAHTRMPMASTTKIMTALVALEQLPLDCTVTISEKAVGIEGSSIYLFAGEQLTMESLLYAMLLESANDAAVAIAIAVAGSISAFAELMNQKAEELGLKDTHFENPHGLDSDAHYTTAYDLAILTAEALRNDDFRTIVSTRRCTIPMDSSNGVRLLINHNKMLRYYPGAIGVKTGFTKQSGRCLVSAAEREGVTLVAVTLNAPDDWNDHTKLLDHGFSQYKSITLAAPEELNHTLTVVGGSRTSLTVTNPAELTVSLPNDHGTIRTVTELPRFLFGAIQQKEIIGRVIYLCDIDQDGSDEVIGVCPLVATVPSENLEYPSLWQRLLQKFSKFFQNFFFK